jgi:RNA polymerase sigma factor (TIGR02999 family)
MASPPENDPRPQPNEVTRLLRELDPAMPSASEIQERLLALIYDELRRTAQGLMRRERIEHTLQPTALVHEAWIRLVGQENIEWSDRAHFLGIAARCMRQVLVDHARAHRAEKRGGDRQQVTLDEGMLAAEDRNLELLSLDEALDRLASLDARAAEVAVRRLFGGMTVAEVAADLDVSRRTVDGDWAMARMWLSRELAEDGSDSGES